MKTSYGFESIWQAPPDVYFFELTLTPAALNGERIHLQFRDSESPWDKVFTMHAWAHLGLSRFLAIKACWWNESSSMRYTLTFDSHRALKIREVTHRDYKFEADLGDLQQLQQVSHVWDAVKAHFYREQAKIGPLPEIP